MTKAKLGNDSEFYYDETLKAWVDGSDPNGKDVARQAVGSIGGPPPMMTMNSSSNQWWWECDECKCRRRTASTAATRVF